MNWIRLKKLHLLFFILLCGIIASVANLSNISNSKNNLPETKSNIKSRIIKTKAPIKVPKAKPIITIPHSQLVYQTIQKYLKPLLENTSTLKGTNLPTLELKDYQISYQQLTPIQKQQLAKWSIQAIENQPLIQCWKAFQTKKLKTKNYDVKWKNIKTYQCQRLLKKY